MPPFLPIIFVICYIVKGLNNLLILAANIQKIPLKAKRMGKKVALSGFFNILRAKKVLQGYNFFSSYRAKRLQKVWLIKKNTLTLPPELKGIAYER